MAYFPFFVDLSGKAGLVAGGGRVALRKVEKLLPYGPQLTVVAPEICAGIVRIEGLTLIREPFSPARLEGVCFALAATDDRAENQRIAQACRERGVPVNVADDRTACDFLFPALVRRGEVSIGVSTGGASPTAAVWLKDQIDALIPERFPEMIDYLDGIRPLAKARISDANRRARFLRDLFAACIEAGAPLEPALLEEMLARYARGEDET